MEKSNLSYFSRCKKCAGEPAGKSLFVHKRCDIKGLSKHHKYLGVKMGFLWVKILTIGFFCAFSWVCGVNGQGTQPLVAIHDSEYTRALESMPASGATPTGVGTTSNQWWITQWHYFVMPDSVKEALRSDGTAFTVIGDSNIVAGVLTNCRRFAQISHRHQSGCGGNGGQ